MIRCQDAAELIPLHVGDDLPAEEARRVEEHLEQCALCGAEYESFAAARGTLLELRSEMPAPGSLWAGVARELEAGGAENAAPASATASVPSWKPQRWLKWTSLAAAALVVTSLVPLLLKTDAPLEPAADGPMIQATTDQEVVDFINKNGAFLVDPKAGTEDQAAADEDVPLTTPASNRPARPPRRF